MAVEVLAHEFVRRGEQCGVGNQPERAGQAEPGLVLRPQGVITVESRAGSVPDFEESGLVIHESGSLQKKSSCLRQTPARTVWPTDSLMRAGVA